MFACLWVAPALLSLLAESLPIYEGLDTDDGPTCLAFPLRIIFMYSASGVLCMLLDGPTYCDVAVVRGTEEALSSRLQSKVKAHNIGLYVLFDYAVGGLLLCGYRVFAFIVAFWCER